MPLWFSGTWEEEGVGLLHRPGLPFQTCEGPGHGVLMCGPPAEGMGGKGSFLYQRV